MTREEAIEYLKHADTTVGKKIKTRTAEALEMAIKALEQEPIIDKIRVEIEQLRLHKAEFLTNDNKVCIDSQAVLNIIDKYKQKSEEQKEYEAEIITRGNCMICGKELTEGLFICKECEDWHDVPSDEMTLEQARQAVKDLRKKLAEHLDQEPCEDCISRQAAIDALSHMCSEDENGITVSRANVNSVLKAMPPVTPKPKMGRWIDEGFYAEGHSEHAYRCSECDEHYIGYVGEFKHCPNYGATMKGESK